VKIAYADRCAISGLSLRNGGGRPEVEAAHIRPVEKDGPDTVRNGLALSGTIHWMFDRGLISIDDDHSILISSDKLPSDTLERLIVPDRRLILPLDKRDWPHKTYLDFHRREIFSG
jgi:putative restriction endonuclease